MASHKYIKRTGSAGNYRYWYKLPDGRVVEGNDAQQSQGRIEHVKRLLAGKGSHNDLSHAEIARVTGHDADKVRSLSSNMATARRQGRQSHDFQEHHMREASMMDTSHPTYNAHVEAHAAGEGSAFGGAPASAARPRRSRHVERGRGLEPEGEGDTGRSETRPPSASAPETSGGQPPPADPAAAAEREAAATRVEQRRAERREAAAGTSPGASASSDRQQELLAKLKNEHGIDLSGGVAQARAAKEASRRVDHQENPTPRAAEPAPTNLGARVTPQVPGAGARGMTGSEPTSEPRPESLSTTPHGRELTRFDPDFAASEEATNKMIEQQQQGANPYLTRATDIFGRIMNDVGEPRRTTVKNLLNAIVKAKGESERGGAPMSKDLVLAHYKAMPGNERVRSLPAEDFERATFHSLDEVLENKPVDPELERMKRGYAAKQFNRLRPFLKQSFHDAHPSAPPPMPTFGDIKSWSEHAASGGGEKPAWAGTTRTAVPREVYEAAHKGADGKPKYPPPWMPIHLMPVWNYVAAKSERAGANPYQTPALGPNQLNQSGKVTLPNQAGAQEGILINSLRKYVQQRGGVHQLIDIPKAKLMEVGQRHEDIFKGEPGSDKELFEALKTKIIDPVALMPFVMKELGIEPKKDVKKSIHLVVDLDAAYVPGEMLVKSVPILRPSENHEHVMDVKKSRRIARIREELRARGV